MNFFKEFTKNNFSGDEALIFNYLSNLKTDFQPIRKRMVRFTGDIFQFCMENELPIKFKKSDDGKVMIRKMSRGEMPLVDRVRIYLKHNGPTLESMVANKLKAQSYEVSDASSDLWRQGLLEYQYGRNGGVVIALKKTA